MNLNVYIFTSSILSSQLTNSEFSSLPFDTKLISNFLSLSACLKKSTFLVSFISILYAFGFSTTSNFFKKYMFFFENLYFQITNDFRNYISCFIFFRRNTQANKTTFGSFFEIWLGDLGKKQIMIYKFEIPFFRSYV